MKKSYLDFEFDEIIKGENIKIRTKNLSIAFNHTILLPQLLSVVNENSFNSIKTIDPKRVDDLTKFLENEISWESERRVWEYFGNCYIRMEPDVSMVNFCINYYVGGDMFFKLTDEELKNKMNFDKWYTFEELSTIKYPEWNEK